MITIEQYQEFVDKVTITPPSSLSKEEIELIGSVFAISGEAGEVLDEVKKGIFHKNGLNLDRLDMGHSTIL
jgi:predicted RecA/RadA family phage recombinase